MLYVFGYSCLINYVFGSEIEICLTNLIKEQNVICNLIISLIQRITIKDLNQAFECIMLSKIYKKKTMPLDWTGCGCTNECRITRYQNLCNFQIPETRIPITILTDQPQ